ncbi:MAG: preprotein translocase subunit SecB [Loktanella salsilacus]
MLTSCSNLIDDGNGRDEGARLVNVRCHVFDSGKNTDPIAKVRSGGLFKLVNPNQEKILQAILQAAIRILFYE